MAVYVMSDIHGEYDKYREMLDKIDLRPEDTLYILGDVVDRGPRPVDILQDMMKRPNVYPLMGNHDLLALDILKKLNVEITEENYAVHLDADTMDEMACWLHDGGQTTLAQFRDLTKEEKADVLDYMEDFSVCESAEAGGKIFVLVHAGLGNFRKGKKLREYTFQELLMDRIDPEKDYFEDDDIYVITGHTPTILIWGKAEIYHSHHNICIDCGACMGGRLACLCLDTMEEYYV
ncbi:MULTISPECIES: metallophosphoesterase [Ruminococcus]|uniref:Metallophosphoesterase n=1 Tax=Ruminococcus albus (strain ATCC 27210 / DSM 20455 / JCM 14654 / NCDO 2250 / 7) TaxID=697329 RepID=E6UGK5_RUMA7|nr:MULTISPECIES: metallophosphoesterase [Ruminococcus]ADU23128.1 metallophosphoesterase [Ruminococcus albus 7 = DSM 20455]MCR5021343.1 fructose-bisphosphatase class III [Ruminococcus sp.]